LGRSATKKKVEHLDGYFHSCITMHGVMNAKFKNAVIIYYKLSQMCEINVAQYRFRLSLRQSSISISSVQNLKEVISH
jgi:hypothetical protein